MSPEPLMAISCSSARPLRVMSLLPLMGDQALNITGAILTKLEDGDVLELEGVKFDVSHTPGHTPGHVVIHNRNAKIAFVGDVLFQGSIGRTDFPRGNHQQLIDSITGKLWPLGDDITFVPGHGATSTFGQERRSNPFVADAVTGYGGAEKQDGSTYDQKTAKRYT